MKVKSGVEIKHFTEKGVVFTDGSVLDADVVVYAYVLTYFVRALNNNQNIGRGTKISVRPLRLFLAQKQLIGPVRCGGWMKRASLKVAIGHLVILGYGTLSGIFSILVICQNNWCVSIVVFFASLPLLMHFYYKGIIHFSVRAGAGCL